MGLNTTLAAKPREAKSGNHAGRLRAQGLLPIVFYGGDLEAAQPLSLGYADFKTAFQAVEGNRFLYTLAVEGQAPSWALLKEFQVDPVSRKLIHADFIKISPDKPVSVKVQVVLSGKAQGVEKGGQIQQGAREVFVTGLPADIPDRIEADVSGLGLGQTLHLSQVKLPQGLSLAKKIDLPVAVVTVPKGLKAEVEAQAAAAGGGAADKKPEKKGDKKK
jgi:large subunit ribosomal protein L25